MTEDPVRDVWSGLEWTSRERDVAEAMAIPAEPGEHFSRRRHIRGVVRLVKGIQGGKIFAPIDAEGEVRRIGGEVAVGENTFRMTGKPSVKKPLRHQIIEDVVDIPDDGEHYGSQ
jgi:hypothetical protein